MQPSNFIEDYLDYFEGTEPPTIYNRWCAISIIGSILGRNTWIQHGHNRIYPNQYIMLVGEAGCRKSTAIKTFSKPILTEAGFNKIAASKTSKEKFLLDLAKGMENVNNPEDHLDVREGASDWGKNKTMQELFGSVDVSEPSECLIMADEFNVFMGHSNVEFIDMLTDLWSYSGMYTQRTKSGKSVLVPNPTISILAGNTQIGISMSFPTEVIGQGFFSRLILVHSEPSGRRISFPPPPDLVKKAKLVKDLTEIAAKIRGEIKFEPSAMSAMDEIYQSWMELDDVRFKSYSSRRFDHLMKLCLIVAAAKKMLSIDIATVEYANTILHYTEHAMPKALGEFGKARNSDVNAKILDMLEKSDKPLSMPELFEKLSRDVASTKELAEILSSMMAAGKIQQQKTGGGFLPKKKEVVFDFVHCKVGLLREWIEERKNKGLTP